MPLAHDSFGSAIYGDHTAFHGARKAGQGGVILVGHIDTVFPKDKFAGYRSDGKIARGPGVLDMKGGLVVATFALKALRESGALDRLAFTFMVVSDEEVGSPDSTAHLVRVAKGAKASLVFESGRAGDAIITRRKGTGSFTAAATGRAAHAGNHHKEGINAIWAVSRFVDRVQNLTDYDRGVTVNVGKISGGIGKNTVPDQAEALADMRFISIADGDALRARVLEAAKDTGVPGARVEVRWGPGRGPMERTSESAALMSAYGDCQRESGLGSTEMPLVGGGSDAATTAALGIPSIDGLGPRGAGFHTLDEYIELDSFVPKAQALVRYLIKHGLS
jgi:glutamate carboxypeptidase